MHSFNTVLRAFRHSAQAAPERQIYLQCHVPNPKAIKVEVTVDERAFIIRRLVPQPWVFTAIAYTGVHGMSMVDASLYRTRKKTRGIDGIKNVYGKKTVDAETRNKQKKKSLKHNGMLNSTGHAQCKDFVKKF